MLYRRLVVLSGLVLFGVLLLPLPVVLATETLQFGVLMANNTRLESFEGFKSAIAEHTAGTGESVQYTVKNAEGDRSRLAVLAREIIAARPAIAIAAGGIEADALKVAAEGSGIPVIFLAVSSAVERGLVASMQLPGGNLTGIDTNDTALVEKRLWYIQKLLPQARRVLIFNLKGNAPSAASTALARKIAPKLDLELQVIEVASRQDAVAAAAKITRSETDVILLLPVAIIDGIVQDALLPLSRREHIPIMGYSEQSIDLGAFAAFGSSRRLCGEQAARMAIKVMHGITPAKLPAETPESLSLTINRRMVEELGLKLSSRSWRLADQVVALKP